MPEAISFRILLGIGDKEPTVWDGKIQAGSGRYWPFEAGVLPRTTPHKAPPGRSPLAEGCLQWVRKIAACPGPCSRTASS